MAASEITLEAVSSVSQIPAEEWNACANPALLPDSLDGLDTLAPPGAANGSCTKSKFRYNPFVSHAFFAALEASDSACARTGWGPRHLLARLDGATARLLPRFLNTPPQGAHVFAPGWGG